MEIKQLRNKSKKVYSNKDVIDFLQKGDFSGLELIGHGPTSRVYEFVDKMKDENLGIISGATVLMLSDQYTPRKLSSLKEKTLSLASQGVHIAPVLEFSPVNGHNLYFYSSNNNCGGKLDLDSLYTMGIVKPKIVGDNAFTTNYEDSIKKFDILFKLPSPLAYKTFDDAIKIIDAGLVPSIVNAKNIIINRKGVYFLDVEEQAVGLSYAEELFELFNNLIGSHIFEDKISYVHPVYQNFFEVEEIFYPEVRREFAAKQVAAFDKFSAALISAATNNNIPGLNQLEAMIESTKINFIDGSRNIATGDSSVSEQ